MEAHPHTVKATNIAIENQIHAFHSSAGCLQSVVCCVLSIDDAVMTESMSLYLSYNNDIKFLIEKIYKLYHTKD